MAETRRVDADPATCAGGYSPMTPLIYQGKEVFSRMISNLRRKFDLVIKYRADCSGFASHWKTRITQSPGQIRLRLLSGASLHTGLKVHPLVVV
jgi:hypothetical protein